MQCLPASNWGSKVYFIRKTLSRIRFRINSSLSLQKALSFYNICKNKSPGYLFNLIRARNTHSLRNSHNILCFNATHNFFKYSVRLQKCDSFNFFKKEILKFIRPSSNSFYNHINLIIFNLIWIKYMTRIRLCLSPLREHKFKHSYQDSVNPICNCGSDFESVIQYFIHYPIYSNEHCILLNSLSEIVHKFLDSNNSSLA